MQRVELNCVSFPHVKPGMSAQGIRTIVPSSHVTKSSPSQLLWMPAQDGAGARTQRRTATECRSRRRRWPRGRPSTGDDPRFDRRRWPRWAAGSICTSGDERSRELVRQCGEPLLDEQRPMEIRPVCPGIPGPRRPLSRADKAADKHGLLGAPRDDGRARPLRRAGRPREGVRSPPGRPPENQLGGVGGFQFSIARMLAYGSGASAESGVSLSSSLP